MSYLKTKHKATGIIYDFEALDNYFGKRKHGYIPKGLIQVLNQKEFDEEYEKVEETLTAYSAVSLAYTKGLPGDPDLEKCMPPQDKCTACNEPFEEGSGVMKRYYHPSCDPLIGVFKSNNKNSHE